jgi:hypothetical protein
MLIFRPIEHRRTVLWIRYIFQFPRFRFSSYGLFLKGNGKGNFSPVAPVSSGLILDGDVRDLKLISAGPKKILLVAVNDKYLKAINLVRKADTP